MIQSNSIIETLELTKGIVKLDNVSSIDLSAEKSHYIKLAEKVEVDFVYFSGEIPSIYIKQVPNFQIEIIQEIAKIQKNIWNQGKVSLLYVESSTEVRIYNCFAQPISEKNDTPEIEKQIQLAAYSKNKKDLEELVSIFGKVSIETGSFWKQERYASQLKNQSRVNKTLITNFNIARKQLSELGLTDKTIVHNLLLRSLFLLYLEDRGATTPSFYQNFDAKFSSYFDILKDKKCTYQLYKKLDSHFNGNLNPVTKEELELVTGEHLNVIKKCFWSEINTSNQLKLFDWRIFDFSIIPIELVSEIYEDFLSNQAKDGAYYTPNILVDFILNKELPYPSKNDFDYNKKVLDPTCGSGIFLVQSLNRLLDRWTFANPSKKLDFETIQEITTNNIFGIEYNPEAIKVAAFSIYLAMLNRLEPKTLWEEKKFPYLIYSPDNEVHQQGNNLFCMSSLGNGPFEDIEFDLVVGNPPFKRGGLTKEVKSYLKLKEYAQEYTLAFLDKVTHLAPRANIALVTTSKILFNASGGYKKFRNFLFRQNCVTEIYNLSIFRNIPKKAGNNLFQSAIGPACLIFYNNHTPVSKSDTILYCAPKTYARNRVVDGLIIDNIDIKHLPYEECKKEDSKIWKVAMWGNLRDFNFIQNLTNNTQKLTKLLTDNNFEKGVGFQKSQPLKIVNAAIKDIPFIETTELNRFFTPSRLTKSINDTIFRRLGKVEAYKAPHILIKEGQKNKKFCASYLDFDCSFKESIYGLHHSDEKLLKSITAYLNSSFAFYYFFLTASSWGIDRPRIKPYELLSLPNLLESMSKEKQKKLLKKIDRIIQLKKSNELYSQEHIDELEKSLDQTLIDALGFNKEQKILIEDTLQFTIDAFSNKEKSIAYNPSQEIELKDYSKLAIQTLDNFLNQDNKTPIWASIYTSPRGSLNIICLHFNKDKKHHTVHNIPKQGIKKLLKDLEEYSYTQFSQSIYFRKVIKYYKDDLIYIIKPNEKRFWSRGMALNDADEIIAELINA